VADVDASGLVTSDSAGIAIITYTLPTGCYVTTTVQVFPTPTEITGTMKQCIGSQYDLHNTVPGGRWSSSDPTLVSIGAISGHDTARALGTVTIGYLIGPGCTAAATVTVVPLPLVYNVTGGGNYCAGSTGVHIGLSNSSTGVNYLLYRGSTATGTFPGTGAALDFGLQTVAGTYYVVATSTYTDCSVRMSGTVTVVIDTNVTPAVGITTGVGDTVCAGTTTTYTALPTNGGTTPTYVWNVNGTNVGTGGSYTFVPANGDLVKVTMTSNAHCVLPPTAIGTLRMTVQTQQNPTVTFTASPNDTICKGMSATYTATPGNGGSAPIFLWTVDRRPMGVGQVVSYIPNNYDTVQCMMVSNWPCRLTDTGFSPKMIMTVETPMIPHVVVTSTTGFKTGPADPLTLTAVVTDAVNPTYQWYINSVPVIGATNQTFTHTGYDSTFEDSVSVVVTNGGICPMSNHGWAYIMVSSLGTNSLSLGEGSIRIVPNPNKGMFNLRGTTGTTTTTDLNLEITDMLGQVVYSGKLTAINGQINEQVQLRTDLASGLYLLSVRSEGQTAVLHFVLER
jgi:hypothetical protein